MQHKKQFTDPNALSPKKVTYLYMKGLYRMAWIPSMMKAKVLDGFMVIASNDDYEVGFCLCPHAS